MQAWIWRIWYVRGFWFDDLYLYFRLVLLFMVTFTTHLQLKTQEKLRLCIREINNCQRDRNALTKGIAASKEEVECIKKELYALHSVPICCSHWKEKL